MKQGLLITFEGPEGGGKSTQIRKLSSWFSDHGYDVVTTFEPGGGSDLSKKIREILLSKEFSPVCEEAELFLMLASRVEHVQKLIFPSLQQGKIVICDRFVDSSCAYQGYGRGLCLQTIGLMNQFAIQGRWPDLTIVLDVDPQKGLVRAASKTGLDRIESESLDFHERVREGFLDLAASGGRYFVVDANQELETVHQEIVQRVSQFLEKI